MNHFFIYTNVHKDKDLSTTNRIKGYLESRGQKVTARQSADDYDEKEGDIPEDADCMIVLGGDGTVLRAAREMGKRRVPIIGINLGTLGYMTEVEPANLEEALDRLVRDDCTKEERMMLSGRVHFAGGGEDEESWCLNDIVISRCGSIRLISMDIYVNGQFLHHYKADGMIVTTPTGSTGYSLSAGGPLIEPGAKLIMLTPVCPHSLNQRSIVFAPGDVIEIEISQGRDGQSQTVEATFDGNHRIPMATGDRIRIRQSKEMTEFIRLNQVSFMEVLHKKFSD